jgi:flagellar hook protein FlgE
LTVTGNNNFSTTAASGAATVGVANTGGRGAVDDDELEQSNVDISSEFSDLIVAQRAFEANSKTVTTFDTVTQDTLSMIR